MTPTSDIVVILAIIFSTAIYFLTLLAVFGYLGMPTKYYYVVIANYVAIALYYYYKYSYYNLNTSSQSSLNVPQAPATAPIANS
jgi:hypothetical protein